MRNRGIAILRNASGVVATVSRAQHRPAAPTTQSGAEDNWAKKLANPISDLVSVPFQFNWEQNVGPRNGATFILNVQPVMPFAMNKDWNLIRRSHRSVRRPAGACRRRHSGVRHQRCVRLVLFLAFETRS